MANSNRVLWLSVANVFACLGVIILHCNGVFWSFPQGRTWYTANFLETFFYWPVPVFFMCAGATSLNYRKRYTTKEFLKKRFHRTLIPFIFWSFAAMLFQIHHGNYEFDSFRGLISCLINTKFFSIYWFFIPLFSIYLSMPLLSSVNTELRQKVFSYIVLTTFLLNSVLPTLFKLLKIEYNTAIQLPVSSGYILYVLAGYLIANTEFSKKQRYTAYILAFLGWFIHFQGTTIASFKAGELVGIYKGYMNFPAVMHSIGMFILFKYFPWERVLGVTGSRFTEMLSKYTFGIYLMHFFFVLEIPALMGFGVGSTYWRILGPLFIFFTCIIISNIFSHFSLLRRLIGL